LKEIKHPDGSVELKKRLAEFGLIDVSVVVVSFNTLELTRECLMKVASAGGAGIELIVVDNASNDGSVEMIRSGFPEAHLIINDRNAGFGAANNQAMRIARGRFLLLLNSDALIERAALLALIDVMKVRPMAAIVAPRLLNADGSLQRSCWRFPSPWRIWAEAFGIANLLARHPVLGDFRAWNHDEERQIEWTIGACLLVRREAYEQNGGFDERFFMYAEETDWQRRITESGWEIWLTPTAEVMHLGGASGKGIERAITERFFHSQDLYLAKHHGRRGLISARMAIAIGSCLRSCVWLLLGALFAKRRVEFRVRRRFRWALARRAAFSWGVLRESKNSPASGLRETKCSR
jgi:GT2 family glycosyltransferase